MTSDTALPFDSVTKIATAALALRLAETGRLQLDDTITRWYAGWRGNPDATVRDLLGHTAGLGDPPEAFWRRLVTNPRKPVTPRQFIAATKAGAATEVWHVPRERLTIAVTWNDNMIDREGGILEALLSTALGTR